MKLRDLRESSGRKHLAEMSIAPGAHSSYWHGTTGEAGRKIAKAGKLIPFDVLEPGRTKSRSGLLPQKGKIYLGDFRVGLANALFRGNMKDGKGEGALVEVDASKMGSYAPDEDEVADIIGSYKRDHNISLYHSDVRSNPVIDGYARTHKKWNVTRDALDSLPDDVAEILKTAFPIKNPKEYQLGREIVRRFIVGNKMLENRWKKAEQDGDYEHFTWLGKKVLERIKPDDLIMQKIVDMSTRAAHKGEVSVKRVLIFPMKDLPQNYEHDKVDKITIADIEKIAEELRS